MRYKALLTQQGGCDYTIGCGYLLVDLAAETYADAFPEIKELVKNNYYHEERRLDGITLLEVSNAWHVDVISVYDKIYEEKELANQKAIEAADLREFERLRIKLGK